MESIILLNKSCTTCKLYLCMKEKKCAASTFDWPALRASTCCLISWWIAPEQPHSAETAETTTVVATSAVGCGRVDEEQEQEEEEKEEEDVASGSGDGSRERRRRRRRATIPDGVGKYINEIHGREGEGKRVT